MIDGLDRLGHDAIVGGYHQDHDIGGVSPTRPHCSKGFVAGRVEEGDLVAALDFYLISADMLRDAAGFSCCDIG